MPALVALWVCTRHMTTGRAGVQLPVTPEKLCQAAYCACFEINFSGRQEGSAVSSIICDRWLIMSSEMLIN